MARSDGTVDRAEHLALELLELGPCDIGPATRAYERHPVAAPLWTDAPGTQSAKADAALAERPTEQVREIERNVARRLERAGLVEIRHGLVTRRRFPAEVE